MNRIVGLETEYGCLAGDFPGGPGAVSRVRDWVFANQRFGLIDVHQRDWDEPEGNGGFLFNGGRAYVDMGHFEYCTPECLSLADVLRYDRAGDALLLEALKQLRLKSAVSFIRNNIDHYSGATFGCHENYLVRRTAPLTEFNVQSLLAFLTLRLLYVSTGRVGAALSVEARSDSTREPLEPFQISQRADYITNDLFEWVQFNRAIINTRDEPLADARKFRRLHLLHGDTNVLPTSTFLKIGTTALVLDLLEIDALPKMALADAVSTFQQLSHAPHGPWHVPLADGRCLHALELLQEFFLCAQTAFARRDAETDQVLLVWGKTLRALASDPTQLVGQVDWISKKWLLEEFRREQKLEWTDPWLKSLDLEFHQIDPERGLGLGLQSASSWVADPDGVAEAMLEPPQDTRARLRSRAMRIMKENCRSYFIDWESIGAESIGTVDLLNPFDASPREGEGWLNQLKEGVSPAIKPVS